MDTWNAFYGNDLAIAILGLIGLLSMIIVVTVATLKATRNEEALRQKRIKEINDKIAKAWHYDTSGK